jgi:fatty-acyl-CoA synthase
MYTARGSYLDALAEVISTGMNSDSVYLWTLPMFHANGWCFPWAVTAVGGTHVCLRKLDPGLVWDLFEAE